MLGYEVGIDDGKLVGFTVGIDEGCRKSVLNMRPLLG
jgi:hypothetical protein